MAIFAAAARRVGISPRPSPLANLVSLHVHVVSHTHWDREWYQPLERFRQRLVALIDDLLDDPPLAGESFLLDGQTIVLDDYLAVRPERRVELEQLIRSGRIESGPWFVLADELIPSGEAIVRNLLLGRRTLQDMGDTSPPVLYCPDSFGHPRPGSARDRDAASAWSWWFAWRGYGGARWPQSDVVTWQAPSADQVMFYHLARDGYELGASLPVDPEFSPGSMALRPGRAHRSDQRGDYAVVEWRRPSRSTTESR